MKIKDKILLSILCVVVLLVAVVTITFRDSMAVNYYRERTVEIEARLVALTNLRAQVRNLLVETYEVVFVEGYKGHENDVAEQKQLVQTRFSELQKVFTDAAGLEVVRTLRMEYSAVDAGLENVLGFAANRRFNEAKRAISEVRQIKFERGFAKRITDILEVQKEASQDGSRNLKLSISSLQTMLISLTVFAILLAIGLIMFTSQSLAERLVKLENATRKIGKGDFDVALSVRGSDELSLLSSAFNHMAAALQDAKLKLIRQQELITHSSKMSALGEMAGSVAHEINSPLAIISLRAEQMEERLRENKLDAMDLMAGLAVIRKTVDRIAKIVSGLRFFAGDARHSSPEKVKLSVLIQETLAFCREKFQNDNVEFKLVADEGTKSLEIDCRSVEISQVLLNLLNNASDAVAASPPDKKKWIRLSISDGGEMVKLTVTDSGPGISRDIEDKIMEPFFTTKGLGKGTGLGLSISKGIVDKHGGTLFFDRGAPHSSFSVILPKTQSFTTLHEVQTC